MSEKLKPTKKDLELFTKALDVFTNTGESSVCCDECNKPIVFERVSESALKFKCECGKFDADMRGL